MSVSVQRVRVIRMLLLALVACLACRLAWLHLVAGPGLAALALNQHTLVYSLGTGRGHILDRHLASLTDQTSQLTAVAFPPLVKDGVTAARRLAPVLGLTQEALRARLRGETAVVLKAGLSQQAVAAVLRLGLDGVTVVPEEVRYGPKAAAPHLVGHLTAAGPGQWRGASGLERSFEAAITGRAAPAVAVVLDGRRQPLGTEYRLLTRPGAAPGNLVTTLDVRVQRVAEEALRASGIRKGAVVVVEAATGELLAMASAPGFSQGDVLSHLNQADGPLVNRALRGFPPGSLFKVAVAAAALDAGKVNITDTFFCPGYATVGDRVIACREHGTANVSQLLVHSCNTAAVQLAALAGKANVLACLRDYGFGRPVDLGFAFPYLDLSQQAGTLPEGRGMTAGDLANLAIGQGSVLVTPLQVAQFMLAVANDGLHQPLQLVREVRGARGAVVWRPQVRPNSRWFAASVGRRLRAALAAATVEGTGWRAAGTVSAAGKTGTAETGKQGTTHAWFAGYAPANRPQLVVVVLAEEGGIGGQVAAPLFRRVVEQTLALLNG